MKCVPNCWSWFYKFKATAPDSRGARPAVCPSMCVKGRASVLTLHFSSPRSIWGSKPPPLPEHGRSVPHSSNVLQPPCPFHGQEGRGGILPRFPAPRMFHLSQEPQGKSVRIFVHRVISEPFPSGSATVSPLAPLRTSREEGRLGESGKAGVAPGEVSP